MFVVLCLYILQFSLCSSMFTQVPAEVCGWSHCHHTQEELPPQPSECSQSNLACTSGSNSNSTTVLCVHGLLCTVGGQQFDVHLPVSCSVPRKNDGIDFCIVDNKVNDSTSVIKLQSIHRHLPFVAMNTCLDTSNLVEMYQCCQLVSSVLSVVFCTIL